MVDEQAESTSAIASEKECCMRRVTATSSQCVVEAADHPRADCTQRTEHVSGG